MNNRSPGKEKKGTPRTESFKTKAWFIKPHSMDGQGPNLLPVQRPLLFKGSMSKVRSLPSNLKALFFTHFTILENYCSPFLPTPACRDGAKWEMSHRPWPGRPRDWSEPGNTGGKPIGYVAIPVKSQWINGNKKTEAGLAIASTVLQRQLICWLGQTEK